MSIIPLLSIAAISQSLLLSLFLLKKKQNKALHNNLLIALLSVLSVLVISSWLLSTKSNPSLMMYAHVANQLSYLIGPLLYFYIFSLLNEKFRLKKKHLLHALPCCVVVIYLVIKFNFIPIDITCRSNEIFIGAVLFLITFIYFHQALFQLKQHGFSLKDMWAQIEDHRLSWIRFLFTGFFMIWLAKLMFFIIWDVMGNYEVCPHTSNLYFLVVFIFLNSVVFMALCKPEIFKRNGKYQNSKLSDEMKKQFSEKLTAYLEIEKPYLNPDLNMLMLSRQLKLPVRYLSQVINETFGSNFYIVMNQFRIEEFKRILNQSPATKTYLEIAYEVGFNSKSTFNAAFKKITGLTPREYQRSNAATI